MVQAAKVLVIDDEPVVTQGCRLKPKPDEEVTG